MPEKKKILIAEAGSESLTREILSILLKSWDYDFIFIDSGAKINETIKEFSPNIIIIDSDLPDADGLSICKMLKEDFITSHIPIILLVEKRRIRKKMLEIPQGVDDYILKPPDPIDLEIRIEMAARRTEYQMQTSYLTRLPGTISAERILKSKMQNGQPFSVLYIDIDNFKLFNDKYSYSRGDIAIKQTSHIISMVTKNCGNKGDFVGHIGGDDFVVITDPNKERIIAENIIANFDKLIPYHYNEADRNKGYISAMGRNGKREKTSLMTISIAVVNNKMRKFSHVFELTHLLAEIKKYLKSIPGSKFLINRRLREQVVKGHVPNSTEPNHKDALPREEARKPLGQLLLEEGLITEEKLYESLHQHLNTNLSIGQVFIRNGIVDRQTLDRLLEKQGLAHENN